MKLWVLYFGAVALLEGAGCVTERDVCKVFERAKVAFVGKVVLDSEQGGVKGAARLLVEERWKGLPGSAREVVVHSGAGWGHYKRLRVGEHWIVFGDLLPNGEISMQSCEGGFVVGDRPKLLEMLRAASRGERGMLGGYLSRKEPVRMGAKLKGKLLEVESDANGEFVFGKVEAGEYEWLVLTRRFLLDGHREPKRKAMVEPDGCWYEGLTLFEAR